MRRKPLCLVWRHVPFEGPGVLGRVLRLRGWDVRILDVKEPADTAGEDRADLLLVMGGPMGVYEQEKYPFLTAEIGACARRLRDDRPTVGICLGAQVMAAALGSRVRPAAEKEIGWYPVVPEPWVLEDPETWGLFSRTRTVLHWHGDTFDLPESSRRLARSERCANQGFRSGRNGFGLQFHLEVPPGEISQWCAAGAGELAAGKPGVQTTAEIERGAAVHGPPAAESAAIFFHAYLARLESATGP